MLKFRQSVARWYQERFGVKLDPEKEVLALIGSKEGNHHLCLATLNPGDTAILPDPGYPAYFASAVFAGAEVERIPLSREDGFLPRFDKIPEELSKRAKLLFLCYPNNPTGAVAPLSFWQEAVAWAKQYDVILVNDHPYSEVTFDGYRSVSILEAEGAMDVAVEFNSLSKPYNMTGWRIGMAVGNPDLIAGISQVKENTDSGVFNAIQYAGIAALEGPQEASRELMELYQARRDRTLEGAPRDRAGAGHAEGDVLRLVADAERDDVSRLRGRGAGQGRRGGDARARLRRARRGLLPDLADGGRRPPGRGAGADQEGVRLRHTWRSATDGRCLEQPAMDDEVHDGPKYLDVRPGQPLIGIPFQDGEVWVTRYFTSAAQADAFVARLDNDAFERVLSGTCDQSDDEFYKMLDDLDRDPSPEPADAVARSIAVRSYLFDTPFMAALAQSIVRAQLRLCHLGLPLMRLPQVPWFTPRSSSTSDRVSGSYATTRRFTDLLLGQFTFFRDPPDPGAVRRYSTLR